MDKIYDKSTLKNYMMVSSFLKNKKDLFSEFELDMIKDMILNGNYPDLYHQDVIREIFDELGILPDNENIYLTFLDEASRHFDIMNCRVTEVGGGTFPRFAKRLSLKQKNGIITVYDPRLDPNELSTDKMILKKEEFTPHTSIANTDLLVGIMPCGGIEPLLDQAVSQNKDFMVWFCEGGPHGDEFDYFEDDQEWFDSTMSRLERNVKKNDMGKVMVKTYPHIAEYPIVYNER